MRLKVLHSRLVGPGDGGGGGGDGELAVHGHLQHAVSLQKVNRFFDIKTFT